MEYFQAVFDQSESPQLLASLEGRIVRANPASARFLGYSQDELLAMRLDDLAHREEVSQVQASMDAFRRGDPTRAAQRRIVRKDGGTLWVDFVASLIALPDGGTRLLHVTAADVTDRIRSNQVLEARFTLMEYAERHDVHQLLVKALDLVSEITESALGFYHFVDADQHTLSLQAWSSRTMRELCKEEGGGHHYAAAKTGAWADCVRERRPIIQNDYASLPNRHGMLEGHPAVTRELVVPILRCDKIVAILGVGNKPRHYSKADLDLTTYIADVVWEITERKRAVAASSVMKERARLIFEKQAVGQVVVSGEGNLASVNAAFARMLGYEPSGIDGLRLQDFIAPEDRPAAMSALKSLLSEPQVAGPGLRRLEYRCRRRDGSTVWLDVSYAVLDERSRHVIATFIDVTDRKDAESELRLLHTAVEQSPASVVITDTTGAIQYVNAKFCAVTGYSREEARGHNPRVLKSGNTPAATYRELWDTISRGVVWRGQMCNKRKDGSLYWENVSISPVRDADTGPVTHYIAVKEDVTTQRALEVQLVQSQKLEAVGHLAAGIAHEINTPTQFASDSVRFLDEALRDLLSVVDAHERAAALAANDAGREDALADLARAVEHADLDYVREHGPKAIAMSIEGLSRIAQIVRAMKDFSHPDQGVKSPADINAAIDSTLTIARNEYKYVATIERDFGELPAVPCLVGELNQVFLNLIVNAAHAIAEVVGESGAKGTIRVRTRREGSRVVISFSDTGAGISEANRQHIFEPFFTTKAVGHGTGQGLTIARSIVVNKHDGSLSFETEEGKGTTFTILLPVEPAVSSVKRSA